MRLSSNIDALLVLTISATSTVMLLFPVIGVNSNWLLPSGICAGCIIFGTGVAMKKFPAAHLSLFFLLLFGWKWSPWWPEELPTGLLIPSLAYLLIILAYPDLRKSVTWFKRGILNRRMLLAATAVLVLSLAALYFWALFSDNMIQNYVYLFHPRILLSELIIFALLFAAISSLTQEIVFRGIFLDALNAGIGTGFYALFIQAVIFGLIHYAGIPSGLTGICLAFAYGFMLGILRNLSGGLLLPVIVHFITDLFIFFMVFYKAGLLNMLNAFPLL